MNELNELLEKVEKNKMQIINLINAQYILRFSNNPWYFEDKLLNENIDIEEVKYQLKLIDIEGLNIIKYFLKD